MRIVLARLMMVHGIAHLVGFVVPWRLIDLPDQPHRTIILRGAVDLGAAGIRFYACAWLILGVSFSALAGYSFAPGWWYRGSLLAAGVSTLFCVLSWPDTRYGVFANALIPGAIVVGVRLGWLELAAK